jgi:hypothetical protein
MAWIDRQIKWIMFVSGALTSTMIYAAITPRDALVATFGEALEGPLAHIVVRNWGALIALIGAMLIYGAFNPAARVLVLTIAGLSKVVFIALVLTFGSQFLGHQVGISVAVDSIMVVLFGSYLVRSVRGQHAGV